MTKPYLQPETALSPDKIQQLSFSFAPALILAAGIQLRVFLHLAAGHSTVDEVAKAADASPRGIRMLLNSLVALELLTKENGRYHLAPIAVEYLVAGAPNYVGWLMETDSTWRAWGQLTQVIRTGQPARRINEQESAETFFPTLIRGLHIFNLKPASRAAQALEVATRYKGSRVLDVACGTAVWSIAVAEADAEARITAQDFPEVIEEARRYADRHGLLERFDFLPGDLKQVDFGEEQFDLAIVGNILHSLGEVVSRDLLRRLCRSLSRGGRVVIVEKMPDDDRAGPAYPLFFALNMLINTQEGDTFTLKEISGWLREAGFTTIETADVGMPSPLVIASKP